ncbi:MAG TPA: DNA translocase FtsK, partial [Balneola sp.]|nr:DNA translocase FtsK [Balneola sp.]
MAKKKLNTAGNSKAGIDDNRKVEIIGVIIIALAILLGLSIVSYTPEDYQYATKLSFMDLFNKDASSRLVQNWLGPVGAYLSHFVVHQLFGYTSIILAVLIFFQGWHIFRRRNYKDLSWITILGVWSMILFSTVLGWMNFNLDFPADSVWSGAAGVAISKVLQNFTSSIGSGIILSLLAIVTLLLLWDRDLQKSIDNLKLWIENVQHKLEDARIARAEKKEIKAQEREERLAERRAEREAAKEEKAIKKEEKKSAKSKPEKEIKEPEAPAPTIDDIVAKSHEEDLERIEKEKRASDDIDNRQKAALDKNSNLEEKEVLDEDSEELEVSVFKGEGDEEAGERDLDKINRDKAKEVPVIRYKFPTIDLLDTPSDDRTEVDLEEIRENKRIILDKLKRHRIEIVGINAIVGPTVTLYELEPAPDVKISKIESYSNDLKMAMASKGLRMLSPIPGKSAVGIEVPNSTREMVYIKQVINTKKFVETDMTLPVAFGKTIENEVFMIDLTKMPHLLMAGATGSGKSVGVNTIITCLLYKCDPENLKFVMIDPKKIELALYRNIQNHFLAMLPNADEPIVTDTSKALETLNSVCKEMDDRYDLLKMALVR